jgi:hypothetical protein
MKTFILLLFHIVINAQIEVKPKINMHELGCFIREGKKRAAILYFPTQTDTTYVLTFINDKYTSITDRKTITFKAVGNTINVLYGLLNEAFLPQNVSDKAFSSDFKLGKSDVSIRTLPKEYKIMVFADGGYLIMNEVDLSELFGK